MADDADLIDAARHARQWITGLAVKGTVPTEEAAEVIEELHEAIANAKSKAEGEAV